MPKIDSRVKATIQKNQAKQLMEKYPHTKSLGEAIRIHLNITLTDAPIVDTGITNDNT